MDFAVHVEHREKIKESEKRDKYLSLSREPGNLRNMKMLVILIEIGPLRTVPKDGERGLE